MALTKSDEDSSEDEIFFGKLTIKEIKKHIFMDRPRCASKYQKKHQLSFDKCISKKEDQDTSLKIVESHSQPNLNSNSPYQNQRGSDASFLEMEEYVNQLCLPSTNSDLREKFDNTFEFVDYILNNGPNHIEHQKNIEIKTEQPIKLEENQTTDSSDQQKDYHLKAQPTMFNSPKIKSENNQTSSSSINKENKLTETFKTPLSIIKTKSVFKTPKGTPLSSKKGDTPSAKKFQLSVPRYNDVLSPVAAYINQSPQAPIMKNVRLKKVLTMIPEPDRTSTKEKNKENIKLHPVAYKSAKETVLINLPEKKNLPKSCIKTSIPKPMVVKHSYREMAPKTPMAGGNIEDSFANLSCQQAELSICTQISAYKAKKN